MKKAILILSISVVLMAGCTKDATVKPSSTMASHSIKQTALTEVPKTPPPPPPPSPNDPKKNLASGD